MLSPRPFYFIRHGQTDWNVEHRAMGQIDIPLNQQGVEQANQAAMELASLSIQHIYTSPLKRALKTAKIINTKLKVSLEPINGLKEASWGIMDGEIRNEKFNLEIWKSGKTPTKAESYERFRKRVLNTIDTLLSNTNNTLLIVSHGGIFFALLDLLGHDMWQLENARPVFFSPVQVPYNNRWKISYVGKNK